VCVLSEEDTGTKKASDLKLPEPKKSARGRKKAAEAEEAAAAGGEEEEEASKKRARGEMTHQRTSSTSFVPVPHLSTDLIVGVCSSVFVWPIVRSSSEEAAEKKTEEATGTDAKKQKVEITDETAGSKEMETTTSETKPSETTKPSEETKMDTSGPGGESEKVSRLDDTMR
jgi:hypothetical protein